MGLKSFKKIEYDGLLISLLYTRMGNNQMEGRGTGSRKRAAVLQKIRGREHSWSVGKGHFLGETKEDSRYRVWFDCVWGTTEGCVLWPTSEQTRGRVFTDRGVGSRGGK